MEEGGNHLSFSLAKYLGLNLMLLSFYSSIQNTQPSEQMETSCYYRNILAHLTVCAIMFITVLSSLEQFSPFPIECQTVGFAR